MSDYTIRQLQDSLMASGVALLSDDTAAFRSLAELMNVPAPKLDAIDAAAAAARTALTELLVVHLPAYTSYRSTWHTALHDARQKGYDPADNEPSETKRLLHELYGALFSDWMETVAAPKAQYRYRLDRMLHLCTEAGLGTMTSWLYSQSGAFDMTEQQLLQRHGLPFS